MTGKRARIPRAERAALNEEAGMAAREMNRDEDEQIPCRSDPESWFERIEDANSSTAKRICRTVCTLRKECLDIALQFEAGHTAGGPRSGGRWGIWGGMDPHEREVEEKRRRAEGTWEW